MVESPSFVLAADTMSFLFIWAASRWTCSRSFVQTFTCSMMRSHSLSLLSLFCRSILSHWVKDKDQKQLCWSNLGCEQEIGLCCKTVILHHHGCPHLKESVRISHLRGQTFHSGSGSQAIHLISSLWPFCKMEWRWLMRLPRGCGPICCK